MRLSLHIPKPAPQATALPPVQASLVGSLLGSGILHTLLAVLIVTTASRWKSSASKTNENPASSISVTFSPPQPESPEQNTPDSPIPDRTPLQSPVPEGSISKSPPNQTATRLKEPKFANLPPMELVTVSEGPQFGNSLPIAEAEPEQPKTEPRPVKKTDTPPSRPSTAKPSSTPPDSKQKKKTLATKQKTGISRSIRLKSRPSTHYPTAAKSAGIQGTCIIEVVVNSSGRVTSARIVKSSGNRSLDAEALRCARSARYHPAMKNGKAFAAKARLPFRFKIR